MTLIGHGAQWDELVRAAERSELAQSYLFFGPRRVGKATFARAFARYLETGTFGETTTERPLTDFLEIGPNETGTIGIDEARLLKRFLVHAPAASSRRTALLTAGEALTAEAQNALLKITEEPPPRALVILVARDSESIAPTLASRFRGVYFGPVPEEEIAKWLVRTYGVSEDEALAAAKESRGAPGLAHDMQFNRELRDYLRAAKEFVNNSLPKDALIAMIQRDGFSFDAFLEAIACALGDREAMAIPEKSRDAWHRVMELRRRSSYFNLNPRLQLTALAA